MPVSATIERFANILRGPSKRSDASERRDPAAEPLWAETQPWYRQQDIEARPLETLDPRPIGT